MKVLTEGGGGRGGLVRNLRNVDDCLPVFGGSVTIGFWVLTSVDVLCELSLRPKQALNLCLSINSTSSFNV